MTDGTISFYEAKKMAIERALAQWPKAPSGYKGTTVYLKSGKAGRLCGCRGLLF